MYLHVPVQICYVYMLAYAISASLVPKLPSFFWRKAKPRLKGWGGLGTRLQSAACEALIGISSHNKTNMTNKQQKQQHIRVYVR